MALEVNMQRKYEPPATIVSAAITTIVQFSHQFNNSQRKEQMMNAKHFKMAFISMAAMLMVCIVSTPSAAADKPIEIVFSTYMPTSYPYLVQPLQDFIKNVEAEVGGRVKFKFYHSGQLYKGKEEFGALERGDIDMAAPNGDQQPAVSVGEPGQHAKKPRCRPVGSGNQRKTAETQHGCAGNGRRWPLPGLFQKLQGDLPR
jgi:hypothetical protein